MINNNRLIDLLIKECIDKDLLLFDSNLISVLQDLTDNTIIRYLSFDPIFTITKHYNTVAQF